ncbi:hypothetical protein [Actinoplanes sp. NPDC051851]|uniref:effector-associated constant component EACC1 n=1 Tax=Actinoplanes sp. NPDC051851 TaxID=3154753 RepID=UPI003448C7B1
MHRSDVDEWHSLWRWLGDEPPVRRFGDPRWCVSPDAREMGGTIEAISLTVGAGLSVAQLVVALLAWRDSRQPRQVTVVITHGDARAVLGASDPDRTVEILTQR